MEAIFDAIVSYIEFGFNVAAAFVITIGGAQALWGTILAMFGPGSVGQRRRVWCIFARWLVLALEFQLAADLLRTLIAPTWADLGQLAVIAAIRTFLNYFLDQAVEVTTDENGGSDARSTRSI